MAGQVDKIATELSDFKTKVQDEIEDIMLKQHETFQRVEQMFDFVKGKLA